MNVRIGNYGKGKTKQHNTVKVELAELTLYFSYETCVAFHHHTAGMVVRKNEWGHGRIRTTLRQPVHYPNHRSLDHVLSTNSECYRHGRTH